jgi:hypothetical protein
MTDDLTCSKCGGVVDKRTGRCFTCGHSSHTSAQASRSQQRPSFLGRLIMIVAVVAALIGMALTWAAYNNVLHSGYDIITGSLSAVISNPAFVDISTTSAIDLTRLFLTCFLLFNIIVFVINCLPWRKTRVAFSTVLLLLFLIMDFFLLVLLNSIPPATNAEMVYLDGKGYHISVFSLFFGSMGALVNLVFPRLPKY